MYLENGGLSVSCRVESNDSESLLWLIVPLQGCSMGRG